MSHSTVVLVDVANYRNMKNYYFFCNFLLPICGRVHLAAIPGTS